MRRTEPESSRVKVGHGNWELGVGQGGGHWETGVPGLKGRHVKSIRIDWDDSPPVFIAEARLRDIFGALRKGFGGLDDDMAGSKQLRLARVLDGQRR